MKDLDAKKLKPALIYKYGEETVKLKKEHFRSGKTIQEITEEQMFIKGGDLENKNTPP